MRTLIIVGVSGDLASRKLLPALRSLKRAGALPIERIIGTSRRELTVDALLEPNDPLAGMLEVCKLEDIKDVHDAAAYLSVPPGTVVPVVDKLVSLGLSGPLALEKPFGHDVKSAQAEARELEAVVGSERLYRVDHYLAKPLVQRLMGADAKSTKRIDIWASETVGLEGRLYFDEAGALRDFGNHLLSLLATTLGARTGQERLELFRRITVDRAACAQYQGYEEQLGHPSSTETFVALLLRDGRHPDTELVLATGKTLSAKETCVYIDGPSGLCELPDDESAYARIFKALFAREHALFLTMDEIMESWRIMDEAHRHYGELARYEQGSTLKSVLEQVGF
jgi:glucose-6-phosphate 1-dehydrogenase